MGGKEGGVSLAAGDCDWGAVGALGTAWTVVLRMKLSKKSRKWERMTEVRSSLGSIVSTLSRSMNSFFVILSSVSAPSEELHSPPFQVRQDSRT
jgi:hypothetical protein